MKDAAVLIERSDPTIVIADLNASMWSPHYTRFVSETGLKNARQGFGVVSTWPVQFDPLMIPIDHAMVSSDILVKDFRVLSGIGSDHAPFVLDVYVGLPQPSE